ncbi:MAG: SOS-induced cell division inhibitor SulA [Pseudomonas sp.]|jgi:cell division inhibitor SulA|nr:SOS-induced cell division inhibitor SulA [Pseudomonas sp.]
MNRHLSFESQQISLFEPLLTLQSAAVAPIFVESTHTARVNPLLDTDAFSEIALSGSAQQCLQLIAPILRQLSDDQKDRWLTLISPPQQITAQWLRGAGLNRERILVLRPSGLQSSQELACEALRLGCSHTVISWFNPLPRAAQARLVNAARVGMAHSLNIRQPYTI